MGLGIFLRQGKIHTDPGGRDEHTLLLLHGESVEDSSRYKVPLTNVGVVVSTAQSKFGGKSLYFDGANHTLKFPSQYCEFKGSDFTIDLWTKAENVNGCLFTTLMSPGSGFMLGQAGVNIFGAAVTGTWGVLKWEKAYKLTTGVWTHWAFVRAGNQAILFKGGKKIGVKPMTGSLQVNRSLMSVIGTNAGGNQAYKGYIDEFRISDVARWTADFTPPTKPY